MERPNIEEALHAETEAYLDYLEKRLEGAAMLAKEISLLKAGVAYDLQLIRLGEQGDKYEHLKYICLDKLSPKYNLVKVLMLNIKSLEDDTPAKVGRPAKEVSEPEEKDTIAIAGELDPIPIAPKGNAFEEASKRIMLKKVNGGK